MRASQQVVGYPLIPNGILTSAFANWWIDPVNGNDGNSGTSSGSPLKTCARRQVIWGPNPQIAPNTQVTVNYLAANLSTDPENYDIRIGDSAGLTLLGALTQSKTGTLQAVTTAVPASNIPWDVTDAVAGLGAADVGKLIRITSGARAGAYALVIKDLTGGKVRTTPFGTFAISTTHTSVFPLATPVATDPYEVIAPTALGVGTMRFVRGGVSDPLSAPLRNAVLIDSLLLNPNASVVNTHLVADAAVYLARSGMFRMRITSRDYFFQAGGRVATCTFDGPGKSHNTNSFVYSLVLIAVGNSLFAVDNSSRSRVVVGASVNCRGGCCFCQGFDVEGKLVADDMAIFDTVGGTGQLTVYPGGAARQADATGQGIWGTNNIGYGVQCYSGGIVTYRTKPVINTGLGAGREAYVGGTDKLWSAIPYVETANNAMIVAEVP
jgi:hypothetical protein